MDTNNIDQNKHTLIFSSIDKLVEDNIPALVEKDSRGSKYILYGEDNLLPEYLYGLYNDVATLKTIIDGTADYVAGRDVIINVPGFEKTINRMGMTGYELVKLLAGDYLRYGGCCYNVIKDKAGNKRELYYLDFRYIRSDEKNEMFVYSKDFAKKYVRGGNMIVLPRYMETSDASSSVVYIKNNYSTTYPIPRYSGAIKDCEIERAIDTLHLSGLQNGFAPSFMISFLNGQPTSEERAEIERDIREKFCGPRNVGRFILNFANGKDNAAVIEKIESEDFGDKYNAASKRSREQIYASFRAIPALFGIMTETTGFNTQEFGEAFKLFRATVVEPIQNTIIQSLEKVLGDGTIQIKQFSLEE